MTLIEEFLEEKRNLSGRIENGIVDFANRTKARERIGKIAMAVGHGHMTKHVMNIGRVAAHVALGQALAHVTGHPVGLAAGMTGLENKFSLTHKVRNIARGINKQLAYQDVKKQAYDDAMHAFSSGDTKEGYKHADTFSRFDTLLKKYRGEI